MNGQEAIHPTPEGNAISRSRRGGTTQHGFAGRLEAGVIVTGDELHATHAASDQALQEGPPMDFV